MKLNKLFLLLAGMLLLTGCSKDDSFCEIEEETQDERVSIRVGMPDKQQSRVDYNPDETMPAFTWEEDDQVYLLGYDAQGNYVGKEIFTLMDGTSKQSGVFIGILVKGATQYHICYKSKQLQLSEGGDTSIDYSNQSQTDNNSAAHIKDYLLLKTSAMLTEDEFVDKSLDKDEVIPEPDEETGTTPEGDTGNDTGGEEASRSGETSPEGGETSPENGEGTAKTPVKLKMQNSIMRFNVKFGVDDINKQIASLHTISWITNVNNPASAQTLQLSLALNLTDRTEITAFVCFDPAVMQQTAGSYMHLVFHGTKDYVASGKSTKGITYTGGKRYYININNTIEPQKNALRWVPQQIANEIWMMTEGDVTIAMDGYTSSTKDVDGVKFQVLEKASTIQTIPAFHDGTKLLLTNGDKVNKVILPRDITTIEDNAFRGFARLKTINIPTTLQTIGDLAFEGCTSLESFTAPVNDASHVKKNGKVLVVGNDIIRCVPTLAADMDLSDLSGVTTLRKSAFKDCSQLTKVTLPTQITSIPESAFQNCRTLTVATFKGEVTTIGVNAFKNCPLLTTVNLSHTTTFGESAFEGCGSLSAITSLAAVNTLGANTFKGCKNLKGTLDLSTLTQTFIEAGTFNGCSRLAEVTLPATVTELKGEANGTSEPNGAFQECAALTTIDLSNVTTFGDNVFTDCTSLSNINTIESAVSIGKESFMNTAITTLVIPQTVTHIGAKAFSKCNKLTEVKLLAPYSDEIDMTLFSEIDNPNMVIYLNRDWTQSAPEDKRPGPDGWGGHGWSIIYVSNADGTTGIEKLPGYEDVPLN